MNNGFIPNPTYINNLMNYFIYRYNNKNMQNNVDWKSCASSDSNHSSISNKKVGYPLSRDGIYSTTDIVFPKLFHEQDEEGSSVITMPDDDDDFDGELLDEEHFPLHDCQDENLSDHLIEQTVYQKVSSWVLSQRRYFLNIETSTLLEDDDIEMIDPVDLFHERILNEYFLITGEYFACFISMNSTYAHLHESIFLDKLLLCYFH